MSNLNFNQINMAGRLVRDPDVRVTPSGISMCRFSIAVNRRVAKGKEQVADFFNVTAWRQLADVVGQYFKKGSAIMISGSLQNSNWKDDKGTEHFGCEIVADKIYFVDSLTNNASEVSDNVDGVRLEPIEDDNLPF